MKKIIGILPALMLLMVMQGCGNNQDKGKDKSVEMMTTQTLGLAYLEEFKLEEAEKEFLKYIKLSPKEKLGYANLGLTYLRMARYPEAEKQLLKAIKIDPSDPDIRLILATVYEMKDERQKAIDELNTSLQNSPGHIKSLYDLSELYSASQEPDAQKLREEVIKRLVEKAPGNIVPLLTYTEILIRNGESDKALEQMEIIRSTFPEFPKEAVDYYNAATGLLRKGDKENALIQYTIFHNYLKVTAPYQAGIMDLKGPGGSLIGFPLITFDQQAPSSVSDDRSVIEIIRFSDVTESAGLNIFDDTESTHVTAADYDGDGDIDLYAGSYGNQSLKKHFLLNNEMGRFSDVAAETGINHTGSESFAAFADYDNDGFPDIFIAREEGDLIYRNAGPGKFEDVTSDTRAGSESGGTMALFFDMDHDGDLDFFEADPSGDKLFRNNADGSFQDESARLGEISKSLNTRDAAFADFDDDEDIDFVIINENGSNLLYSNQRQGVFRDITSSSGLSAESGSSAVAAGDYNNDGFIDLFIASSQGSGHRLYTNRKDGTFENSNEHGELYSALNNLKSRDASFLDFDNDGFLDLLVAGESAIPGGRGIILLHNDGKGGFMDVSELLPENLKSGRQVAVFDYNDDGDLDIAVAGIDSGLTLLRNDGGNTNHFIKIKLVGLRAGSAKNNHFGIGAKMEMRAGDLYQTLVVTDPNIHFGIGKRTTADVIRITWTNGVPQNIFFPGSDQSLVEAQTLKGSCPFLYTWDGDEYVFVKDIMWRSALGMPLGIMGGTTAYAFADASDDYLRVPGTLLKPENGDYSIQLTSELWETIYFDKVELVAVDHPETTDIYIPEQFTPPPFPGLEIFHVGEKRLPVTAVDSKGTDILPSVSAKDDIYLSDFRTDKYQGLTEMREIILDPGKTGDNGKLFLFLNGWIFPTDASINFAMAQSSSLRLVPPSVQVMDKNGNWVTAMENIGFPMGKDKTVIADLTGKFLSSDHRVKIITNMQIYWDYIFFSDYLSEEPLVTTVLKPVYADLHYRGFSKSYRKGGRYGPHWFDYSQTDSMPKWRDLAGNYTRYGDVLPLLVSSDNKYIITNAGDETSVRFDAGDLPGLREGWRRDFLIHSVGWVKDGDMNTAFGNSVEPLPFHGMKSYPPGPGDSYPQDPELQKYNREYNTRVVTPDRFLNALRGKY